MADMNPEEIREIEIPDSSPSRAVNPVQFFRPSGDPVADRDFRPSTFVFDNDEEIQETEDGHGNMRQPKSREPVHPSMNKRRIPGRETPAQDELSFDEVPPVDPNSSAQPTHPAGSEEPQHAPGITGSKQNQSEQE